MPFLFQVNDLLNFLTQPIQLCTNVDIVMENFIGLSRVNYACIASTQNRFVLPDLPIAVNLFKYKKTLYFLCKSKKVPHSSFYEDEWFLNFGVFTHFTPFESDFVNITLGNYG